MPEGCTVNSYGILIIPSVEIHKPNGEIFKWNDTLKSVEFEVVDNRVQITVVDALLHWDLLAKLGAAEITKDKQSFKWLSESLKIVLKGRVRNAETGLDEEVIISSYNMRIKKFLGFNTDDYKPSVFEYVFLTNYYTGSNNLFDIERKAI